MNYIENNLATNETVIKKANFSPVAKNISLAFLIFTIVLVIFVVATCGDSMAIIFIPFVIIAIVYFLKAHLYIKTTELAITNKRIIGRKGAFSIETIDIPLDRAANIQIKQDILSRFSDEGTIIFETGGKTDLDVLYVKSPHLFRKDVLEAIEQFNITDKK